MAPVAADSGQSSGAGGRRTGVNALVRDCLPDAVVSLALEAVSQSGAGVLDGPRRVARWCSVRTSTPVRFCASRRSLGQPRLARLRPGQTGSDPNPRVVDDLILSRQS